MSVTETAEKYELYVGGKWIDTPEHDEIRLPYDGSPVGTVPRAGEEILKQAIGEAEKGAEAMSNMGNFERADLLLRIGDAIRRDAEEFTHLVCAETGKPIKEARVEVDRCVQTLIASAHEARQLCGEVVPMDFAPSGKGRMAITVREPIGIIGAITPFNSPLNLALHKMAPALAAGNAVVHKPAERTPLSALRLARTVDEAGTPKGAYNVVTGSGPDLGMGMVRDPNIAMITFTGSVQVGKEIRAQAGLKKVSLELGNNSAVILEPDTDLKTAVSRTRQGAFTYSGQVCISVQRVYAHESLFDSFLEQLTAETEKLRIGHPYEESTDISSLIDEKAAIRVKEWIDEAVARGARVITGGERKRATITPTILTDVPRDARISCQEVFGPVVAIYGYRDLEDAIAQVNNTPYGLQAGIFTNDIGRAFRAARKLQFGGVLINDIPMFRVDHMPYGGMKQSGLGREGPRYAIEEMTEEKIICWKA
ncbi:MAG: aldehyde dehydrogenase family protein [Acidobacteriaceae bacterium]|nr:aldehyde dehydrogenase family protein [Acidobacteriaceae bacterium]